jgi:hypothetical protein
MYPPSIHPSPFECYEFILLRNRLHGTLRTGAYKRLLRTHLSVVGGTEPIEVGLLTGSASSPYVTITGGALTANEM